MKDDRNSSKRPSPLGPTPEQSKIRAAVTVGDGVNDGFSEMTTAKSWWMRGHFDNPAEARGAFKLAHQQGLDGMGKGVAHWMGLTESEFSVYMRKSKLPCDVMVPDDGRSRVYFLADLSRSDRSARQPGVAEREPGTLDIHFDHACGLATGPRPMSRYLARIAATGHVLGFVSGATYGEALGRAFDALPADQEDQRLRLDLDGPPPLLVKKCGCGREYNAADWRELEYVGASDDGVESIELRNCACGSTLAVNVEALG